MNFKGGLFRLFQWLRWPFCRPLISLIWVGWIAGVELTDWTENGDTELNIFRISLSPSVQQPSDKAHRNLIKPAQIPSVPLSFLLTVFFNLCCQWWHWFSKCLNWNFGHNRKIKVNVLHFKPSSASRIKPIHSSSYDVEIVVESETGRHKPEAHFGFTNNIKY